MKRQDTSGKLNPDRRKHFVSLVARVLASGAPTYFEHEASCRHGLRVRFILEGSCWADADALAADIVASALHRIGAQRPTWLQGQREWTVAAEQCNWCRADLDPSMSAAGDSVRRIAPGRRCTTGITRAPISTISGAPRPIMCSSSPR